MAWRHVHCLPPSIWEPALPILRLHNETESSDTRIVSVRQSKLSVHRQCGLGRRTKQIRGRTCLCSLWRVSILDAPRCVWDKLCEAGTHRGHPMRKRVEPVGIPSVHRGKDVNSLVCVLGAVICASAHSFGTLLVGRFIVGSGVGLSTADEVSLCWVTLPLFRGSSISANFLLVSAQPCVPQREPIRSAKCGGQVSHL